MNIPSVIALVTGAASGLGRATAQRLLKNGAKVVVVDLPNALEGEGLEANQLVENGAKEITLLGQNVNAYNFEKNKLSDLILAISKIKDLKRIRYTTSHPRDFSIDLMNAHRDCEKLMPLIHLPVQSGSNKILDSMNRKHTYQEYLTIIRKIQLLKPDIKFSSDFIIGYPGETIDDFHETLKILKDVSFINSYSYIFSARPGTPAFKLPQIDLKEAKKRLVEFQSAAKKIKIEYRKSLLFKTSNVLFENKLKNENKYFGRDEYSNPVIVDSDKSLSGQIKTVKIVKANHNTLLGEITSNLNEKNYAA